MEFFLKYLWLPLICMGAIVFMLGLNAFMETRIKLERFLVLLILAGIIGSMGISSVGASMYSGGYAAFIHARFPGLLLGMALLILASLALGLALGRFNPFASSNILGVVLYVLTAPLGMIGAICAAGFALRLR